MSYVEKLNEICNDVEICYGEASRVGNKEATEIIRNLCSSVIRLINLLEEKTEEKVIADKKDVLVIRLGALCKQETEDKFREDILKQKEEGVVIIPAWCAADLISKDTYIKVEQVESPMFYEEGYYDQT